jgi:hypothetical protein
MSKVVKLTESDLTRIVKSVLKEQATQNSPEGAKIKVLKIYPSSPDDLIEDGKKINPSKAKIDIDLSNGITARRNSQFPSEWNIGFNQSCINLFTNLQGSVNVNREYDLSSNPGCVFTLKKKTESISYRCDANGCKKQEPKIGNIGNSAVNPLKEQERVYGGDNIKKLYDKLKDDEYVSLDDVSGDLSGSIVSKVEYVKKMLRNAIREENWSKVQNAISFMDTKM